MMPKALTLSSIAQLLDLRPQYSLQGPKLAACLEKSDCLDIVLGIYPKATVAVARQLSPELRSMNVPDAYPAHRPRGDAEHLIRDSPCYKAL